MTTRSHLQPHEVRQAPSLLLAELLSGLRAWPKTISPTWLYDERGSQLFDQICELPEYYLTRTEGQILTTYADQVAAAIGEDALLVEFGSGASLKTRTLLDRLVRPCAYVPVDISQTHLISAAHRISASYPNLEVLPVCADFTQPFALPRPARRPARTAVFFPGSTLGNFDPPAAIDLMRGIRAIAEPSGAFIVGIDLIKDLGVLTSAYNDAAGVTAEFNLNLLRRLNREFDADFDLAGFAHEAVWAPAAGRIEMHLVSLQRQRVTIAEISVLFEAGERLVSEHCHKFTVAGFAAQAAQAGWTVRRSWTDERRYFSVNYLEPA